MKTTKSIMLLVSLMLGSISLKAQTTPPPPPTFFIVETMKSMPGKTGDYEKAEREVWKKVHQERVKQGLILSWNLYAVRSPSGTERPFDYVTVTLIQGWNKVENPYGKMQLSDMSSMLNKEQTALFNETGNLRNLTNSTIYYGEDYVAADPKNTKPAKYQIINYMSVKESKVGEYMNMETKIVKPMHVEMMKTGGRSAWGLYSRQFTGEGQGYNYVTSDFYNTWEDMGKYGDFKKALAKVHPGMTQKAFEKSIFDTRTMVNQELWELIDSTNQ